MLSRQPVEPLDPRQIVAAIEMRRGDMAQRRQSVLQPRQIGGEGVQVLARPGDEGDALRMVRDFGQRQVALALVGAHLAEAQQPRQPAIAVAVDRGRRAGSARPSGRAGSRSAAASPAPLAALWMRTTPASVLRSATPIASMPSSCACHHQFDRVRRAAQEAERRRHAQLDERRRRDRPGAFQHQLLAGKAAIFRHQPNSSMDVHEQAVQDSAPPRPSPITPSR